MDPLITGAQHPLLRRALHSVDAAELADSWPPQGGPVPRERHMQRWMTGAFWSDTVERAVRTAAQAALGVVGAGTVGLLDVAWPLVGSIAGMAAAVSLLTSLAAGAAGDPATAGFTTGTR